MNPQVLERVSLQNINDFIANRSIAITGISKTKQKFGNTIFRILQNKGFDLYPVHPVINEYNGKSCYHSIQDLPDHVSALVICTNPENTCQIIKEAHIQGINHVWIQQGAENIDSIVFGKSKNMNIIHNQCILMYTEPVGAIHRLHRFCNKLFRTHPE